MEKRNNAVRRFNWDHLKELSVQNSRQEGEQHGEQDGDDDADTVPSMFVPTEEDMEARWEMREAISDQTLQHRRIHEHTKPSNVVWALQAREQRGPVAMMQDTPRIERRSPPRKAPKLENGSSSPRGPGQHLNGHVYKSSSGLHAAFSDYNVRPPRIPCSIFQQIQHFCEYSSVTKYQAAFMDHLGGRDEVNEDGERPPSSSAVSTISVAFSPDRKTMASTHGDHTVKITCCSTGRLLETLEGHPRTPWTVKFHPTNPHILASGCLGFQVRVWNWKEATCLQMIRLDYAIISLSFHSSGHILAVASGSRLHFWDYDNFGGRRDAETGRKSQRGVLTEVEQRHMLRCVHFPPGGKTIIVGGMNPNPDERRNARNRGGMSGGGISFYLRLWDFDLEAALRPQIHAKMHRKPMANPRTVVPRALLYNDGGFDVSPDGKMLCACAEYWLPEGVNSAMDLLERESNEDHFNGYRTVDADGDVDMSDDEIRQSPSAQASRSLLQKSHSEGVLSTPPVAPRPSLVSKAHSVRVNNSVKSPPRQRHAQPLLVPPPPRPASLPITPPNPSRSSLNLSPPSPPGRRFPGGLGQRRTEDRTRTATSSTAAAAATTNGLQPFIPSAPTATGATQQTRPNGANGSSSSSSGGPNAIPPPPPQSVPSRPPHPLSVIAGRSTYLDMTSQPGRYVPHVVTVSLETSPVAASFPRPTERQQTTSVAKGHRPRLGQLLQASPLDGAKASAVTCVKFSPSADFCLLGYGVREPITLENGEESRYHPVTALYQIKGGMTHVSTLISSDDDVNIARFHPDSGYGFVYGTKQGRVRMLSTRPWNYYDC
mmetsp:Transcript_17504/g.25919  ORF Transcript_17504/g.25919 Transcript_17504/m.25919 type:complete len:826 (+) Transcript_17504:119-2596(+)